MWHLHTPLLAVLMASLLTPLARAQSTSSDGAGLSVQHAVDVALNRSPLLQQAKAAQDELEWRKVGTMSGFLPHFSIQGTRYFAQNYVYTTLPFNGVVTTIPNIIPNTYVLFNASITLFDGLSNIREYSAASDLASSARKETDWKTFKLEQDVRLKFFQALAAEKLAEVSEQNVKTLDDHLKQTRLLRHGGLSTEYDVLRTEAQLSDAESERLLANDNVDITKRALAEAMGLEDAELEKAASTALAGELPVPQSELVAGVQLKDAEDRADLVALRQRTDAASEKRRAANGFWFPKVDLFGQHNWYNNLDWSFNSSQFQSAYQVGLTLTWNIFDGMQSISNARALAAQDIQTQKALHTSLLHLPNDFDLWKRRYVYAAALHKSRTATLEKSKESVRLAREGYRAGARTNSDVLDAALDLFRSRAGVVSSQLSAVEAMINLELAVGRKFENDRIQ